MNKETIKKLLYEYNPIEEILRNYYFKYGKPMDMDVLFKKHKTSSSDDFPNKVFNFYEEKTFKEHSMRLKNDISILKHPRFLFPFQHEHEFIEMIYVFDGKCKIKIDNKEIQLSTDEICIIAPQVQHSISVFDDSIILNIIIRTSTFSKTLFDVLIGKDIINDFFAKVIFSENYYPYLTIRAYKDDTLKSYLISILSEQETDDAVSRFVINEYFTLFIIHLLRQYKDEFVIISNKKEFILISSIINHMQLNYANITLDKLSLYFNLSREYISNIIKKYTGKKYIDILQSIKMKEASKLLKNTNFSISDISNKVGYMDASYFNMLFKKHFHITPSQYRKNQTNINA